MELAPELESLDGKKGWIPSLRFGVAGALLEYGEPRSAISIYRKLIEENPKHRWAWIGLLDAMTASGDVSDAVLVGQRALREFPQDNLLWRKTSSAMMLAEGPSAAAAFLAQRPTDTLTDDDKAYGISLYRMAGRPDEAEGLSRLLLQENPNAPIAHMALIEGALRRGDSQAASAASQQAMATCPEHPELLLRIAQGYLRDGKPESAMQALDAILLDEGPIFEEAKLVRDRCVERMAQGKLPTRSDTQELEDPPLLTNVERPSDASGAVQDVCVEDFSGIDPDSSSIQSVFSVLASLGHDASSFLQNLEMLLESDDVDYAVRVLHGLISANDTPWYIALQLVELSYRNGFVEEAEALSAVFEEHAWSDYDRQAFEIESRLLVHGPRCALEWIRNNPCGSRHLEAAKRLGRVLLSGGAGALAARYLGACRRRWPDDDDLDSLANEAMVACGAGGTVAHPETSDSPSVENLGKDGASSPLVRDIEHYLLAGDMSAAEACLAALSVEDGALEEALICRPRATRIGSLLNEARILSSAGIDWVRDDTQKLATFADGFYLPARSIVGRLSGGLSSPAVCVGSTSSVHLVWPSHAPLTDEAHLLVKAWEQASHREVSVHRILHGEMLVAEAAGSQGVQAYRMARDPEQKADLLMLAIASSRGGAVLRADQWPSSSTDEFLDAAPEVCLFVDTDASLSFDALLARKGHPFLQTALENAILAGLARDNDHRWLKTGPGLLMRTLAQSLMASAAEPRPPALRPISQLRSVIHRHTRVVPTINAPPSASRTRKLRETLEQLTNSVTAKALQT